MARRNPPFSPRCRSSRRCRIAALDRRDEIHRIAQSARAAREEPRDGSAEASPCTSRGKPRTSRARSSGPPGALVAPTRPRPGSRRRSRGSARDGGCARCSGVSWEDPDPYGAVWRESNQCDVVKSVGVRDVDDGADPHAARPLDRRGAARACRRRPGGRPDRAAGESARRHQGRLLRVLRRPARPARPRRSTPGSARASRRSSSVSRAKAGTPGPSWSGCSPSPRPATRCLEDRPRDPRLGPARADGRPAPPTRRQPAHGLPGFTVRLPSAPTRTTPRPAACSTSRCGSAATSSPPTTGPPQPRGRGESGPVGGSRPSRVGQESPATRASTRRWAIRPSGSRDGLKIAMSRPMAWPPATAARSTALSSSQLRPPGRR